MTIRDQKAFWTGVMFVLIGAGALTQVMELDIGTPTEMGPGFFPLVLAVVLVIIGGVALLRGIRSGRVVRLGSWPWASTGIIMAGVVAFSALIGTFGLIPAVAALVFIGCAQRLLRRPIEVVVVCAILILMSVGLFVYGIQLPIPLW